VTGGHKFGGDFLCYQGDPHLFHAQYCVRVQVRMAGDLMFSTRRRIGSCTDARRPPVDASALQRGATLRAAVLLTRAQRRGLLNFGLQTVGSSNDIDSNRMGIACPVQHTMEVRSHVLLAAARRGAMGAKKHFLLAQVRLHNLKTSNIMITHVHMLAILCHLGWHCSCMPRGSACTIRSFSQASFLLALHTRVRRSVHLLFAKPNAVTLAGALNRWCSRRTMPPPPLAKSIQPATSPMCSTTTWSRTGRWGRHRTWC